MTRPVHDGSDQGIQNSSRDDETTASNNQPRQATLRLTDEDGDFCRTRTGDQACGSNAAEELCFGNPMPLPHELIFHHRDVSGRSAECRCTELQEDEREFSQ